MSYSFVDVATCKRMLRIDDSDEFVNADFSLLIEVASELIVAYLKRKTWVTKDDEVLMDLDASPPIIPQRLVYATVSLVGYLYKSPDANLHGDWSGDAMPPAVRSLLYQLRDPEVG